MRLVLICLALAGCGSSPPRPRIRSPELVAEQTRAVELLQKGQFDSARSAAEQLVARDPGNPHAHLIVALTRYKDAGHQLSADLRTVFVGALRGGLNHQYLHYTLEQLDTKLAAVAGDLDKAAADSHIAVELCLACWEIDWNGDGRVNQRDRVLFQIENDANGEPLADDDARRKPTFRFDVGDLHWAQAMLAFQRALLDLVIAYHSSDIDALFANKLPERVTLRLAEPKRVSAARMLVLAGLQHADHARRAYLAETDDDREWVPNPRQQNHPLPLPVDQALYTTWEAVTGDVERLMRSEQGIDVAALAKLAVMDHAPTGFVDVGRLFSRPRDLVLEREVLRATKRNPEAALSSVFGDAYVRSMKPSPLIGRLERMNNEIKRGEESFARKLRYLLWLN